MMDYGFATYRRVQILRKGELLGKQVPVKLGSAEQVEEFLTDCIRPLLDANRALLGEKAELSV